MQALEDARRSVTDHAHRDVIVLHDDGSFAGKVTMVDVFRALEPNYRKVGDCGGTDILASEFVMNAVQEYGLWLQPMQSIRERGAILKAGDVMHVPDDMEFLQETDTLDKALHLFVMGVHQPLIAKRGDEVVAVVRFGDVFEIVRQRLLRTHDDQ
jgi:hypothetical protein